MPSLNKIIFLFTCFFLVGFGLFAQKDTTQLKDVKSPKKAIKVGDKALANKSPKTASWLSAAVPGAGHVYIKKYHKAAIIWAGIGGGIYAIHFNTRTYKEFKSAYIARLDDDPNTNATGDFATASIASLESEVDRWRGYRDLSIILTSVGYMLNIVWASVDAHLLYFDVTDDISLNIRPSFNYFDRPKGGLTLALRF